MLRFFGKLRGKLRGEIVSPSYRKEAKLLKAKHQMDIGLSGPIYR